MSLTNEKINFYLKQKNKVNNYYYYYFTKTNYTNIFLQKKFEKKCRENIFRDKKLTDRIFGKKKSFKYIKYIILF